MSHKFTSLHCHSHYSLLDGLSKPEQMAERAVLCGFNSLAITDHGSVSGVVDFASALKNACKYCGKPENTHGGPNKQCLIKGVKCEGYQSAKLKPIFGCELYLCNQDPSIKTPENRSLSHLCVLAKNLNGWKNLVKITSLSNNRDYFYYKPRLNLDKLASLTTDIVAFSGHPGSDLANILFMQPKLSYRAKNIEEAKSMLKTDWFKDACNKANHYIDIFGKDNFFLEIQLFDKSNLPVCEIIAQCLRKVSRELDIPCIATSDAHYSFKEQAGDQRILLCSELGTTLDQVRMKLDQDEDFTLSGFFKSNQYYIHNADELLKIGNTPLELHNAFEISEMCELYSIDSRPLLPKLGSNAGDIMYELAIKSFQEKPIYNDPVYRERFLKEMRVINEAELADYFLIVQDYTNWARKNGIPADPRGSAGGCLVSYLLGISNLDPIPPGLIFERFYNDGRNSPGKASLPDIDLDVSKNGRAKIIEYINNKYGSDYVCNIVTFNQLKGRGALTAVLSAYGNLSFEEIKKITQHLPDPSKVSTEMQESLDETGEASIIEIAIENNKKLHEYCFFNEHGELDGPLASEFAQAIRLEGTKTQMGKHAAGIIISSYKLSDMFPMVLDTKGSSLLCALEMVAAEKCGGVKFDILGVAYIDKLKAIKDLLSGKEMESIDG